MPDQDKITRIERVKFITYYPPKEGKQAAWSIKGDTEGTREKAMCGKNAMKGVMDRLTKGDKNEWGGTEFTPNGNLGLNVSWKKVTVVEAKGTGSVRERGGKVVTFDSIVALAEKAADAGANIAQNNAPDSDDPAVVAATVESAQKWGGTIFIAAVDAGEAHVDPTPEPVKALEEEGFEQMPEALEDEDGDDLPF